MGVRHLGNRRISLGSLREGVSGNLGIHSPLGPPSLEDLREA